MIINIICIIIWLGWFSYGLFGKNEKVLRIGLVTGSLICILTYLGRM